MEELKVFWQERKHPKMRMEMILLKLIKCQLWRLVYV
jgi:hypothetical protein